MAFHRGTSFRAVLTAAGIAALYVACAKLGFALAFHAEQVSAVWPPTGFGLAAVLLFGRRAVAGVLVGAFAANATAGEPLWVAAAIAAGNTLEAVAGAAILRRFEFDAAFQRLRDVLAMFAAVAIAPVISATVGVTFLVAGELHHPAHWAGCGPCGGSATCSVASSSPP